MQALFCEDEFDYWRGLEYVWDSPRTLINAEHDMALRDAHLQALIDCPHPLCSWCYLGHWASTGLDHDVWAAGTGEPGTAYLQGSEQWADWSAIGLVKLAPEARVSPLRRERWMRLELAVHDAVKRPWHMHADPPLPHHHF